MNLNITKAKVFSGLIWRFAERCGAQGVTLIVSIVLARILKPEEYGLIALVNVFIVILNVFVDSGLGNALIQKKDADDLDFSTVFFFNIGVCFVLYAIMFMGAPLIAAFYKMNELISIIRVLSVTIIISGVRNIQQAYVSKYLLFRKFFGATISGTIVAAIIGIIMAYSGCGIWALVFQQIINVFVGTLLLWIIVKWRPQWQFSIERLKELFSYGWKLLISSLLETVTNELRSLLIGKAYTSSDLAFYNQGQKFPSVIVTNINVSVDSVIFPTMSSVQNDTVRIKAMVQRAMKISIYIMAPLMIGLAVVAEDFVKILLTEKWLPCVFYLRIACITFMFYPLHTANLNAIKALGKSGTILKLQVIKKGIDILFLLICIRISMEALAISSLLSCIAGQVINSWPNKKLLGYGYKEQIKDILPSILLACIMGIIIYPICLLNISNIVILFLQIIVGICIYVLGSYIFRIDSFCYILSFIKMIMKKTE